MDAKPSWIFAGGLGDERHAPVGQFPKRTDVGNDTDDLHGDRNCDPVLGRLEALSLHLRKPKSVRQQASGGLIFVPPIPPQGPPFCLREANSRSRFLQVGMT